jgi:hypothetical protein
MCVRAHDVLLACGLHSYCRTIASVFVCTLFLLTQIPAMTYESCCEKFDVRAFVLSVLDESEIADIDALPPLKRPKALFRLAKDVSNTEGEVQRS